MVARNQYLHIPRLDRRQAVHSISPSGSGDTNRRTGKVWATTDITTGSVQVSFSTMSFFECEGGNEIADKDPAVRLKVYFHTWATWCSYIAVLKSGFSVSSSIALIAREIWRMGGTVMLAMLVTPVKYGVVGDKTRSTHSSSQGLGTRLDKI